jgi:hydroxysqualene synthase
LRVIASGSAAISGGSFRTATIAPVGVDHYENFPVASLLCPAPLRPAVQAIYHFARTADDIADEGDATPAARLALLQAYRAEFAACVATGALGPAWPHVFAPLREALQRHALPPALLGALLDAFEQDVHNPRYADRAALLDYCRRSANPVGRLLLHLYGVHDAEALHRSDAICTALQLINFWQDLGGDLRRGRNYLPLDALRRHGIELPPGTALADTPALRQLIAELCAWAAALMHEGAPLVRRVPGRAAWELRAVVQGGLRILEKIARSGYATMLQRPHLTGGDCAVLAWRVVFMRAPAAEPATA